MTKVRKVERGGVRDTLGEGLLWSERDNAVYWTDILAPALNRLSLGSGAVERWPMPEMIGWVVEREHAPGLIAGFRSGFAALELEPLRVTPLVDPEPHLPGNRLNDAKADRHGRIWAGTMPVGADRPTGALYRLGHDLQCEQVDSGYVVANGPAFSPDGRWMYHNDTGRGTVYRFALGADGTAGAREPFIQFPPDWGRPDGMTVDSEGHLWIAHWGGSRVSRFTPEGALDRWIPLPATQITNVCFAGSDLSRMFVTSAAEGREEEERDAGALFEIDPGVRGLPPHRFRG